MKLSDVDKVCKTATPGPWRHDADSGWGEAGDVTIWAKDNEVACQLDDGRADGYLMNMGAPVDALAPNKTVIANAEFIVVARTALPALLAAVRANIRVHGIDAYGAVLVAALQRAGIEVDA